MGMSASAIACRTRSYGKGLGIRPALILAVVPQSCSLEIHPEIGKEIDPPAASIRMNHPPSDKTAGEAREFHMATHAHRRRLVPSCSEPGERPQQGFPGFR